GRANPLVLVLSVGLGSSLLRLAWPIDCFARNESSLSTWIAERKHSRDHPPRYRSGGRMVYSLRSGPSDHTANADDSAASSMAILIDGALGRLFPRLDHPIRTVERSLLVPRCAGLDFSHR